MSQRENLVSISKRVVNAAIKNKMLVVIGILIITLFIIVRNAVTKLVLNELNEFELYAAKVIVLTIIQPIMIFIFWKYDLINTKNLVSLSMPGKLALTIFSMMGIAIFFISIFIIKRQMLTNVVTLHTTFQIILACLIGYFILNENLRKTEYAGLGLIITGMLLMYYR